MIRMNRVGLLAEQIRGVSFPKNEASLVSRPEFTPIVRAGNIVDGRLVLDDLIYVPSKLVHRRQLLRRGDVVVATSSGSINVVGKAAMCDGDIPVAFGAFLKVLRPVSSEVSLEYFGHYFQTAEYRRRVSTLAAGVNINNLRSEHLDNLEIPVPPLDDQRRIAAILETACRQKGDSRRVVAELAQVSARMFDERFGTRSGQRLVRLSDVAAVSSGITKGRRTDRAVRPVPYLAVANVQDGRLDLGNIKMIDATEAEIEKYMLRRGDLVLTEGGDPDKLGRGTVWQQEIDECIHQNHIFKVRVSDREAVSPAYLSALIASSSSKKYFMRSAKQTTGIASINMTQLKALPVLVPAIQEQRAYERDIESIARVSSAARSAAVLHGELFESLQLRAFRGEL